MREIKFQILYETDFKKGVAAHYTSLDRLTSGEDKFPYGKVHVIAKRQFTGLLDCNGVEIYEGDIVVSSYCSPKQLDKSDLGIIEFSFGYFLAVFTDCDGDIIRDEIYDVKVIGNIHQHAHLLEK